MDKYQDKAAKIIAKVTAFLESDGGSAGNVPKEYWELIKEIANYIKPDSPSLPVNAVVSRQRFEEVGERIDKLIKETGNQELLDLYIEYQIMLVELIGEIHIAVKNRFGG